jgi:hypothetical protein
MTAQVAGKPVRPMRVFVIMSDQPDCCGECGSRLELIDERKIDGEYIFVGYCGRCVTLTLLVEE